MKNLMILLALIMTVTAVGQSSTQVDASSRISKKQKKELKKLSAHRLNCNCSDCWRTYDMHGEAPYIGGTSIKNGNSEMRSSSEYELVDTDHSAPASVLYVNTGRSYTLKGGSASCVAPAPICSKPEEKKN